MKSCTAAIVIAALPTIHTRRDFLSVARHCAKLATQTISSAKNLRYRTLQSSRLSAMHVHADGAAHRHARTAAAGRVAEMLRIGSCHAMPIVSVGFASVSRVTLLPGGTVDAYPKSPYTTSCKLPAGSVYTGAPLVGRETCSLRGWDGRKTCSDFGDPWWMRLDLRRPRMS